jgi:hypothetical protein
MSSMPVALSSLHRGPVVAGAVLARREIGGVSRMCWAEASGEAIE